MKQEALTLFDLNALVRRSLEQCLPDEYWIQAELSDVRSNSTGHCYLEFIQKDPRSNNLIAKARGMIWSNIFRLLKPYFEEATGQMFGSGIKVLVKVTVQFHELYGYSLTVLDIDPTYTLGDMARRRREILQQLEEEGVLTLNKELEMPLLPQRIAVISSATAAGYGDFCHQLQHNSRGFFFYTELFPAMMQGNQVEESVLSALDRVNARLGDFDVVVIIRGGGATSDLSGFDTYLLAAACAQFPLPIITGIGHERDDTVLDSVAHTRVKTPTAAAELLINRMDEATDQLEYLSTRLREGASAFLERESGRLLSCQARISALVVHRLSDARFRLLTASKDLMQVSAALLARQRHRLELFQQRITDASPDKLLARGYSITLKEGKPVTDASQVSLGDEIITRLHHGELTSIVNSELLQSSNCKSSNRK
ncbi:exodeoxyribonuclease VII large subunit [Bacteroides nordii]|uniref:Exodeoxyribonuclease 7 large subunit n=1 Tax=Bacteroides nordii CL02T12C05 TaxID=997884 RepID=I8X3F4_9BACE|nr:exodeoxyribonuclease VII large subunit [Bacteroides nordii]EIY44647.1 exodeoxyribonuclease VII, large subunit [Bacteroides nordii CL02T12C05]